MGLIHWFTRNFADTELETHADVQPVDLAGNPDQLLNQIAALIRTLPRWQVLEVDPHERIIRATRRTRVFRFVDEVTVRLEPLASKVRIHARSQSRIGVGDLGQNRRNLRVLLNAISTRLEQV